MGRFGRWVVVFALVTGWLAACSSDISDRSLCRSYDRYAALREEVQGLDPATLDAADVAAIAEDYEDAVRDLRQVADGRYEAPLLALEARAADVVRTAASIQSDADAATWMPLLADDLEDLRDGSVFVVARIGPTCSGA